MGGKKSDKFFKIYFFSEFRLYWFGKLNQAMILFFL